ncbi:precorrin-3B C(17)-methyltransferase [bacterium]|nr:precorrin-3B C(17)-methyltransferase [bacterium]
MAGIGPGDISFLNQKVREALNECQVVVGYKTYIRLLGSLINDKEIISSGMTEEIKRAKLAIKKAVDGKKVCLISSGDPGIYGMAGVVLELLNDDDKKKIEIQIIPAISAASACASLLGAPLMHDFVSISLSDLLTDKKLIEKRVKLAAQGDFVIVFYNPKSKKRIDPLKNAWQILMKHKSPQTPVGIVRNAYRDNEEVEIIELKNMFSSRIIDMFTTIIVGNCKTYVKGKYMITPRGYDFKKEKTDEILSC